MPPRVNDAAIELRHFRKLGDDWLVNVDITFGEYADDHSFDAADAFRLTGSGAVVYEWSPAWKWVLGAAYVGRLNTKILPIAGLIYKPNDDIDYAAGVPRAEDVVAAAVDTRARPRRALVLRGGRVRRRHLGRPAHQRRDRRAGHHRLADLHGPRTTDHRRPDAAASSWATSSPASCSTPACRTSSRSTIR